MIAIHSHPTKQPNTNLMKYGVATAVTPAHNTSNNPNKLSSHQFTFNVPYNATVVLLYVTTLFFMSK